MRTWRAIDQPTLGEILEAAGCRDEDVRRRRALRLGVERAAAVDGGDPQAALARASDSSSVVTWAASSRVGTSTSADGRASVAVVRSTIGSANASVLPEPVGDFASTSSPASASGRTSAWIGNGV